MFISVASTFAHVHRLLGRRVSNFVLYSVVSINITRLPNGVRRSEVA